jgi:hypothetical protein
MNTESISIDDRPWFSWFIGKVTYIELRLRPLYEIHTSTTTTDF